MNEAADFILDRLAKFLVDNGISRDAVDAALPVSSTFTDVRRRAAAVDAFRETPVWDDLVTVFTRPANLAKKLPPEAEGTAVDRSLFAEEAEDVLFEAWVEAPGSVDRLISAHEYLDALEALAGLRPAIDRFFTDVLVMADDPAVRLNRLCLLAGVAGTARSVAHLDKLQA